MTELAPVVVHASTIPETFKWLDQLNWKLGQFSQGDHFHIRGAGIIDAIAFRHDYLQKHPMEKAVVVVVTEPKGNQVTQAVVAYTSGSNLRAMGSALGDIKLKGLIATDINRPEKIRKYIQDLRHTYLNARVGPGPIPLGVIMTAAEASGDYSHAGQLYLGTPEEMLDQAYHWLTDRDRIGLIPASRSKVEVEVLARESPHKFLRSELQDAVVFDWDGVHYMYNDPDGTLAIPIPIDPATSVPYLILDDGDTFECMYFSAVYAKQHPKETVTLISSSDMKHDGAAFTLSNRLYMFSPFLGFLKLPEGYRIDNVPLITKIYNSVIVAGENVLSEKKLDRLPTSIPRTMLGDSELEQVERAYLAFRSIGLPVKFVQYRNSLVGFSVDYRGAAWRYLEPTVEGVPNGALKLLDD